MMFVCRTKSDWYSPFWLHLQYVRVFSWYTHFGLDNTRAFGWCTHFGLRSVYVLYVVVRG